MSRHLAAMMVMRRFLFSGWRCRFQVDIHYGCHRNSIGGCCWSIRGHCKSISIRSGCHATDYITSEIETWRKMVVEDIAFGGGSVEGCVMIGVKGNVEMGVEKEN